MRASYVLILLAFSLLFAGCPPGGDGADAGGEPEPTVDVQAVYTPAWAFEPWISKDISDGPDTYAFVEGFMSRDIPVGAVVLDSPWETNYNTFIPNPNRYPDFDVMVGDLKAQGVRTVLWITQMVNNDSIDFENGGDTYDGEADNYREGARANYYINDGQTYFWWKGTGAAVDFFNPDARDWWHAQQDHVLDMGIAGWKLDFGEEYIDDDPVTTADGEKPLQEYSEAYYDDFLSYGRQKQGLEEFVTMVRAYDKSYSFDGRFFARPEDAPVAWMGDNYRDWRGMADVMDHLFRSANAGYAAIGSDIGGYLQIDNDNMLADIPFDLDVFWAWTAQASMTPFFQLHGQQNLTPWTVEERTDETIAMYRKWATLHHEMVPHWYSLTRSHDVDGAGTPLRPIGTADQAVGDYRYFVGDAFFVAPFLDETLARDIELPAGSFLALRDLGGDVIPGGQTLAWVGQDADDIGLFLVEGAIVVLAESRGLTQLAPVYDGPVVVTYPAAGETTQFDWWTDKDNHLALTAINDGGARTVTLGAVAADTLVVLHDIDGASSVTVRGEAATAGSGVPGPGEYVVDEAARAVYVGVATGGEAAVVVE